MDTEWKPRHVTIIVAMICIAAIGMPVAVTATDFVDVRLWGGDGVDAVGVNGDGTLSVRDRMLSGDALHFDHKTLTSQRPVAALTYYGDSTTAFTVTSIGVTALPSAKGPSYVEFRVYSIDPAQEQCTATIPPAGALGNWNDLPSLWVQPHSQTEYTFSPRIEYAQGANFGPANHCVIARLVSGGPVDAHDTSFNTEANF